MKQEKKNTGNWKVVELVRHVTEDGKDFIFDSIPLGTQYLVDLNRVFEGSWGDTSKPGETIKRMTIYARNMSNGHGGFLPMELFDMDGAKEPEKAA